MTDLNADFQVLVTALSTFCDREYAAARGGKLDHASAASLRKLFTSLFPNLAKTIPNAPDVIYCRRIIRMGVERLNDAVISTIWHDYYQHGGTLTALADTVNFSTRTVRRYIAAFPERVALQLWEKSQDLVLKPEPPTTQSLRRRALMTLMNEFSLAERPAEVLLAFCQWQDLGQKEIGNRLFIGWNTLKTHKRRILQHMRARGLKVETMSDAVHQGELALRKQMGEQWDQYKAAVAWG